MKAISCSILLLVATSTASAAYVMPMIGGGQVGMMGAPMIHADVSFDGTNIGVVLDTSHDTPMLRPLTPPAEFDPAQPWAVLTGKAYNYQYAFNPSGFITLPVNAGIWVERISQDAALEVYTRPPAASYTRIFENDGDRFKWSGAMQHNAYAVLNPTESTYSATYKIYIGDANTGDPLDGYGSANTTWTWTATPIPEPASLGVLGLGAMLLLRRRCSA